MGYPKGTEQLEAAIVEATPLGIYAEPQVIANSVAFLASDEASFITGINMIVDGGLHFSGSRYSIRQVVEQAEQSK